MTMKLVEVTGTVERFDGHYWSDVNYGDPIEVVIIGEQGMWTFATVIGDVPIRWVTDCPSVMVAYTEAAVL